MKKAVSLILTIATLFVLLLSGCNKNGFVGVYSFRMGKLDSKHFSVIVELTDENYVVNEQTLGKKFYLTFDVFSMIDLGEESSSTQTGESEVEGEVEGDQTLEEDSFNFDFLKDGLTISGYYNEGEKGEQGTRLLLSLSFFKLVEELDEKYGDIIMEYLGESLKDFVGDFSIPSEIIELVIFAHVTDNQLTMVVPISMDDLLNQLYWYGYDINRESFEMVEVEPHEVGTHPTKEDIDKINETYPQDHKTEILDEFGEPLLDEDGNIIYIDGDLYRDFYTINLALLKE